MAAVTAMLSWLKPMWPKPRYILARWPAARRCSAPFCRYAHAAGRSRDDGQILVGGAVYLAVVAALDIAGLRSLLAAQDRRAAQPLSGRDLASRGDATASQTRLAARSPSQLDSNLR